MDKKEYQREWRNKRKEKFFSGKACSICGSTKNLELYRIEGKDKSVKDVWTRRKDVSKRYISECIVICEPCRRKKVNKVITRVIHGSSNTYKNGCRCGLCRKASALYQYHLRKAIANGDFRPGNILVHGAWFDMEGRKK